MNWEFIFELALAFFLSEVFGGILSGIINGIRKSIRHEKAAKNGVIKKERTKILGFTDRSNEETKG